ncbi:hydroxymethylglutaryl-CoA reductase, degradative [Candidatus Micrarchaeota archaeon]|nr:hydroxymethylglutaryl-CoA reductase, degradative [Candidatus Micrarchaeota archaeon]
MLSKEFRNKSPQERAEEVATLAKLDAEDLARLKTFGGLDESTANRMIENVVGAYPLPLGIADHFKVNGKERLVPMVVEEPSVVAAASHAAKLCLPKGFTASTTQPIMIGQIQLVHVPDFRKAQAAVKKHKGELLETANEKDPVMVSRGGGAVDLESRVIKTSRGDMLILHLLVNVQDAMGANAVNTMCEAISPKIEQITGAKARLRILSNLAVHRTAKAHATWTKEALAESTKGAFNGEAIVEAMLDAYAFAANDAYRACTANKGIFNGMDAVVLATGNDWRAMEAGGHVYAMKTGQYTTLTRYWKTKDGDLTGEIELPMAVGVVGGATRTHPMAKTNLKILGVSSAKELGEILASVGLAQNFAAMRALATTGIQQGHMKLHAANIAVQAGATGDDIDRIAAIMAKEKNVNVKRAKELLDG